MCSTWTRSVPSTATSCVAPLGVLDLAQQVTRGSNAADAGALEAGDEIGATAPSAIPRVA
jgi:hypothetical protein